MVVEVHLIGVREAVEEHLIEAEGVEGAVGCLSMAEEGHSLMVEGLSQEVAEWVESWAAVTEEHLNLAPWVVTEAEEYWTVLWHVHEIESECHETGVVEEDLSHEQELEAVRDFFRLQMEVVHQTWNLILLARSHHRQVSLVVLVVVADLDWTTIQHEVVLGACCLCEQTCPHLPAVEVPRTEAAVVLLEEKAL